MSAFIVSPETMQKCVSALTRHYESCEDADALGQRLFDLNRQAVAHRYPNCKPDELPGSEIPKSLQVIRIVPGVRRGARSH